MGEAAIRRVVVVVPACDEELLVGSAVAAVRRSAARLGGCVVVDVVVVANGCSDATAARARAAGAHVIVLADANVGAARAAGCAWAVGSATGTEGVWIANTDADSVVPEDWLPRQVRAADAGADVFLGTVGLTAVDGLRHGDWLSRYARRAARGGHVHGASLGVRAAVYVQVGGFGALRVHEDVDLVARLASAGAVTVTTDEVPVVTSARHTSRVVGGVADDLADSVAEGA